MKHIALALILLAQVILFSAVTLASGDHTPPTMPKEFDTLKKLIGTWSGTSKMEGKDVPVTVVYKLTSGGTAITETLMPNTPHEMISVYYKDGSKVGMTHYCSMGNQPHMKLRSEDSKNMTFEVADTTGLTSMTEPHMHSLHLTFNGKDSLKQEWVNYKDGKQNEVATFNYTRQAK